MHSVGTSLATNLDPIVGEVDIGEEVPVAEDIIHQPTVHKNP